MNKAPKLLGAFFIFNNMKIFFESVVDEIIDKINLETTYFIIPNRRSKVYLKKEILKKYLQSQFLHKFIVLMIL